MNIQKDPQNDGNQSLQNLLDSDKPNNHQWQDFENLSDAEKKLLEKQVEYQLKNVAESIKKRQGNIPGEFSEIIKKLFKQEPPKFDWKGYLRKFVSNSRVTYTKKSRRKYNKRFKGNPGIKIKFKSHILLGVDTSGSVSMSELKEFYSEIGHIHKTGHEVTVAQCDTKITDISKFDPKKEWKIHGRGGTIFQPVIDEFNKGGYTTLIYFTDGEASAPINCPKNILWVLSSKSKINEALPGNQIKLN